MACNKSRYINHLQMMINYFLFAHNLSKRTNKIYHTIALIILYRIVGQALHKNQSTVLKFFCKTVSIKHLFLSYNNINLYKKFQD